MKALLMLILYVFILFLYHDEYSQDIDIYKGLDVRHFGVPFLKW